MAATTTTRTEMVLAAARANRSAMTDLEVERLLLALEWAELYPGDEVDESVPWAERELEIAGSMPRVIRLMAHVETTRSRSDVKHVYLHGAQALRRDIAQ